MSAWTVIAHTEVGSGGAADITFSSIAGTYTDLLLVYSIRTTRALFVDDLYLNINNGNLDGHRVLEGNGSAASSGSDPAYNNRIAISSANTSTANTFGNGMSYFPNYAGSTAKSISSDAVSETNATQGYQFLTASLDTNTAAITSLKLYSGTGSTITQYSSATLYGITKGSSGGVVVS